MLQKNIFLLLLPGIMLGSCKKFVQVPLPDDQLTTEIVFSSDNTALQAVTGIYSNMMYNSQQFTSGFTTLFAGMAADELYHFNSSMWSDFLNDEISPSTHPTIQYYFWDPCYQYIYAANKLLEGAASSPALSPQTKMMVTGEAKFIRAFCYFYLTNLFGDVPLVLSTNYQATQSLPRSSQEEVYNLIINDLEEAKTLLGPDYPSAERVRPNKFAVAALLARVYLYQKNWTKATAEATEVIDSGVYGLNPDLNTVFEINSNETIWQLDPVNPSRNTWEGNLILTSSASAPTYLITDALLNSFETGDLRQAAWVKQKIFAEDTVYHPYKYKVRSGADKTEYYVVLRLAEMFLIRSEALAEQDDLQNSLTDLNAVRERAGLPDVAFSSKAELLTAIEQERRIEFLSEWGHRWFDLKRTGRATEVLGSIKPTWQTTDELWPIPQAELNLNPYLSQNAGY